MREITLLLKAAQQGANGCFFEVAIAGHDPVDRFHTARLALPYGPHHFVFEVGEGRSNAGAGCRTLCHGTLCTTTRTFSQELCELCGRQWRERPVPESGGRP